jgi:hypothetical protein
MPLYVCVEVARATVELVAVRGSCCGATGKSRARWGSIGEAGGRGDALLGAAIKGGNSARGVGATGISADWTGRDGVGGGVLQQRCSEGECSRERSR